MLRCASRTSVSRSRGPSQAPRLTTRRSHSAPFTLLRRFASEKTSKPVVVDDAASLTRLRDPFEGISAQPFPKEVAEKLMAPIAAQDIEIRPDGIIYLPEINRILNTAIGPGGWALMPRAGTSVHEETSYSREFALFCFGRYVAQARGEQSIQERSIAVSLGNLDEAARSGALTRCCKDIGVASELWDPIFIAEWKSKNAVDVWVEHVTNKSKRKLWRRSDRAPIGYPYREISGPAPGDNTVYASEPPPVMVADTFVPGSNPLSGRMRPRKEADAASSSSAAPSAAEFTSHASSPARSSNSGEFDMSAVVPAAFKKFQGKTWGDMMSSEDGRKYLAWVADKFKEPTKSLAAKALEMHQTLANFDGPDGPAKK